MKEDVEFREIGKGTPYKVPEGFFDSLTDKTLQKAKLRVQNHKRNLTLWRTMAVAASIAVIASVGYLVSEPQLTATQHSAQTAMEKQPQVQQPIVQKLETDQQSPAKVPRKAVPAKVEERGIAREENAEVLGNVLADLSDEELLELDAMYKTDPMIGETE